MVTEVEFFFGSGFLARYSANGLHFLHGLVRAAADERNRFLELNKKEGARPNIALNLKSRFAVVPRDDFSPIVPNQSRGTVRKNSAEKETQPHHKDECFFRRRTVVWVNPQNISNEFS